MTLLGYLAQRNLVESSGAHIIASPTRLVFKREGSV